jgi:hypothetical protein
MARMGGFAGGGQMGGGAAARGGAAGGPRARRFMTDGEAQDDFLEIGSQ